MDKIETWLREDYERWLAKLTTNDQFPGPNSIGADDVLRAHYLLCDYFIHEGEAIAVPGPRSLDLLVSAVSRQFSGYAGQYKWKDSFERLASLFYGLVKNHAFFDGNKRTALLIALYNLHKIRRTPDASQREFELLTVRTAANELEEYSDFSRFAKKHADIHDARVYFLARFFQKRTRQFDSRFYNVTFRQLAAILRRFDLKLSNPNGNYIDLIKEDVVTKGIFRREKVVIERRIAQVGFPGWTKEVTQNAMSTIRKAAKLTPNFGVDSQVFYKDADPMAVLINRYHGPLTRLKDK
jgi:death-on-curing protein